MPPAEIILLRHGEEPADETDPDLDQAGRNRADRLVDFIPATFGNPDFVITAAANRTSVRCYLTMRPLCTSLGMRICASLKANESQALASQLLVDDTFSNKTIVVCWTHTELPHLAEALKARRADYPRPWDESVFNLILHVRYSAPGRPSVTKVVQPF